MRRSILYKNWGNLENVVYVEENQHKYLKCRDTCSLVADVTLTAPVVEDNAIHYSLDYFKM
jgi:hypothetical protein